MSTITNHPTTPTAPTHWRYNYDTNRDERPTSPQPRPLSPNGPRAPDTESNIDQRPSEERKELAKGGYDHHKWRSTAATRFDPSEIDDPAKRRLFERLKGWNDGRRDPDRQIIEGHGDKMKWAETYAHKLELPSYVVVEAHQLLVNLGDIRRLGYFNDLHVAVLAALTESYRRWGLRQQYRLTRGDTFQPWRERDDFRELWEDRDLDEDEFGDAVTLLDKKTDV